MDALTRIDSWPVETAAVAVLRRDGDPSGRGSVRVTTVGTRGPDRHVFPLASVTKPLVAYAALLAVEEGAFELDDPAGPEGSTIRHLLAHTSGLAFAGRRTLAPPGTRRIYSNTGFDVLGAALATATGMSVADYLAEAVTAPLGMGDTRLLDSPASGAVSTVADLRLFGGDVGGPCGVARARGGAAPGGALPGVAGVRRGYGLADPNDWGLGFEIRGRKNPHWTGATSDPSTFGHFGRSGTFLWVDPVLGAACVALSDRDFGDWSITAWPPFTDAVLADLRRPVPA
ncbi:MAG: serine hydrolase domain-containing protein [Frankia sp.]